jgi:4-hydroxy-2-oxoheptanedioate aldolase
MIRHNRIKAGLKKGETFIGTFVKVCDPSAVEVLALAGFDFIIIDNEHTVMDQETLINLIRAADATEMLPTVRTRDSSDSLIRQVLDSGSMGIQVPMTNTAAEVRAVVSSSMYAPEGTRGFAASQRSAAYGTMNAKEYAALSNANIMTACYCETLEAIKNIKEIAAVDGLDIVFIGPYDLSQALGVIGEPNHPIVQSAIDDIIKVVRAAGKAVGTIASDAEQANSLIQRGVQYICLSSDLAMIASLGKSFLGKVKKTQKNQK